uniref:Uncharacterized protein n=1 Tax=Arundo donax TaxID=35708 RepID=A0A0A9AVE3_ARUDO
MFMLVLFVTGKHISAYMSPECYHVCPLQISY